MLLGSFVNTPIDHSVFHYLPTLLARCFVSCVNVALKVKMGEGLKDSGVLKLLPCFQGVGRASRKGDQKAREWAWLYENLKRAVDQIYERCRYDDSVVECKVKVFAGFQLPLDKRRPNEVHSRSWSQWFPASGVFDYGVAGHCLVGGKMRFVRSCTPCWDWTRTLWFLVL